MANGKPKQVTSMAGLAKLAGCSVMTVSLALRDSAQVSEKTRERVRRLAAEHGYRKNPFVAALMATRRTGRKPGGGEVVALLTKFDQPIRSWRASRPFYSALFAGMEERCRELGFRLEEFPVFGPGAPNGRQLTRILLSRGIRGVVLMPGGPLERAFPDFDQSRFAVIAAAFHAKRLPIHRTASDYGAAMEMCLAEAERRGYRRIGLTMNRRLDPELRYAFSGRFLSWQAGLAARARVPLIAGVEATVGKESLVAWYRQHRPDCVISTRAAVLDWFQEEGIEVPGQVGCVFLPVRDDARLSGFDAQPRQVGRTSISVLARELYLNHQGVPATPEVVLVGGVWQEGGTLRSAPPESGAGTG